MRSVLIILCTIVFMPQFCFSQGYENNFLPNTIIFKVKPEYRGICSEKAIDHIKFTELFNSLQVSTLNKKFPNHRPPADRATGIHGMKLIDLSLIYELKYDSYTNLQKAIRSIEATGLVEYAQPHNVPKPLFIPNDDSTKMAAQYYLNNIQAYLAWDVETGDTNVVIGILDTGTDWDHPDLKDNIKYNYEDPIGNGDEDGDGFIDNYRGWDMGENDNDPSTTLDAQNFGHGVFVSGLAAASTNNGTGIAGVGFNCKFLPIKVGDDNGSFIMAYEGIVYAADHGCQIINCSWGDTFPFSQFEQDIVSYATINKNALVVAAAGNSHNEGVFIPASLKYVLSVGGTDINDMKYYCSPQQGGSNYGINLDICAPAKDIYSTSYNDGYAGPPCGGTSWATPIVAGCAAIVKSQFPSYSALQIAEQLKVTADNIDTVSGNAAYAGKLGSGRVNLYNAVTNSSNPSIVMTSKNITDGNDEFYMAGETLTISGVFINYLSPATNLVISMSCSSPYVSFTDNSTTIGAINTLNSDSNTADPFIVELDDSIPYNEVIELKINYNDGAYYGFEYISLKVNRDFVDVEVNNISTTIGSGGRIGYMEDLLVDGLGFAYKGEQLLWEAGMMVGISTVKVADNIIAYLDIDRDFARVSPAAFANPSVISDFDVQGVINDDSAGISKMDLEITHNTYAWSANPNSDYVIVEYHIVNKGAGSISNLYAGIFADWDVWDYSLNKAAFDATNNIGYVHSTQSGSPYVGIKLLTRDPVNHYAIDHILGGGTGMNLLVYYEPKEMYVDSLSSWHKYTLMSTNRDNAGTSGGGNDVIDVVSTGPLTIGAGDTATVAFALMGSDNLLDLINDGKAAQYKYDSIYGLLDTTGYELLGMQDEMINIYPNPASDRIIANFMLTTSNTVSFAIYNLTGQKILSDEFNGKSGNNQWSIDIETIPPGIYYYKFDTGESSQKGKISIVR